MAILLSLKSSPLRAHLEKATHEKRENSLIIASGAESTRVACLKS